MNNRQGVMTALVTSAALGAAAYGIRRGVQNGTFQRLPQTVSNAFNNPTVKQITKPLQTMASNTLQAGTNVVQQQQSKKSNVSSVL